MKSSVQSSRGTGLPSTFSSQDGVMSGATVWNTGVVSPCIHLHAFALLSCAIKVKFLSLLSLIEVKGSMKPCIFPFMVHFLQEVSQANLLPYFFLIDAFVPLAAFFVLTLAILGSSRM